MVDCAKHTYLEDCGFCDMEDQYKENKKLTAEIGQWKTRALRAEKGIKTCSVGACPTLAKLAMEDMGWEEPTVPTGLDEND